MNNQRTQEYRPIICCYNSVCTFDSSRNELKAFVGADRVKGMVIDMYWKVKNVLKTLKLNAEIKSSTDDGYRVEHAACCSTCEESFEENDITCRVHRHRTGTIRGATSKV